MDEHAEQILLTPAEALAAVTAWELQGTLVALALRRMETMGTFGTDGSVSMKAWLREHARMTDQGAGDLLATGRFLDNNAAFAEAAVTGQLSGGQVSLARRLGKPKHASSQRSNTNSCRRWPRSTSTTPLPPQFIGETRPTRCSTRASHPSNSPANSHSPAHSTNASTVT